MKPPNQISTRLAKAPTPIIPDWIFCKLGQKLEVVTSNCDEPARIGPTDNANKPPPQSAAVSCSQNLIPLPADPRVNSRVKTNGITRRIMPIVLPVVDKLSWLKRFSKSPITEILSTKPAHKTKNPSAALLLIKNVSASGPKTMTPSNISAISFIVLEPGNFKGKLAVSGSATRRSWIYSNSERRKKTAGCLLEGGAALGADPVFFLTAFSVLLNVLDYFFGNITASYFFYSKTRAGVNFQD